MQNNTSSFIIENIASFNSDASFIRARLIASADNKFSASQIDAAKQVIDLLYPLEALKTVKQKSVKRIVQMSHVIANGLASEIDTSYAICAALAGITTDNKAMSYASVHAIHGLHKEGADVRAIGGVSKSKLNRFLGLSGAAGTITAKSSYSFGKNGIFTALGIVSKCDKSTIQFDLNKRDSCGFLVAYCKALSVLKDSDFEVIKQKFESKS